MNNYIEEYKLYAENKDHEVFAYLIYTFLELGFKPNESLEKFRKWFSNRIKKYIITGPELEVSLDSYYDYWSEQDKQIKNFKISFFNNPILKRYIKCEYKIKKYDIDNF